MNNVGIPFLLPYYSAYPSNPKSACDSLLVRVKNAAGASEVRYLRAGRLTLEMVDGEISSIIANPILEAIKEVAQDG
jgi:hypothetical protein